jgi:hypothetical protein
VDSVSYQAVFADIADGAQPGCERGHLASSVGGDPAGDNESSSTFRSGSEIGGEPFESTFFLFQPGMHAAHHDSVGEGGETQVKGAEQARVRMGHGIVI